MNPIVAKFLVLSILVVIFVILIVFGYLFYKVVLKPYILRIFFMRKVLKTAQILLKAGKDEFTKVNNLVDANMVDVDLIRIAEEEILKSQKVDVIKKPKKKGFFSKLFENWRKDKSGKKESVQQVSRGEDRGKVETKQGIEGGSSSGGEERVSESGRGSESGGRGEESNVAISEVSSTDDESRSFQGESIKVDGGRSRYFN